MKILLGYVKVHSSKMAANIGPVTAILEEYGLLPYIKNGQIAFATDYAMINLAKKICPLNFNGCAEHTIANDLSRTFTHHLGPRGKDQYEKATMVFNHASSTHSTPEEHMFPSLNKYLTSQELDEDKARLRASLKIQVDDPEELDLLASNFSCYPSISNDYLVSTRFRKAIDSFNSLLIGYEKIEALEQLSHPQTHLAFPLPDRSFVEAATTILKPFGEAISFFDTDSNKTSAGMLYAVYCKLVTFACTTLKKSTGWTKHLCEAMLCSIAEQITDYTFDRAGQKKKSQVRDRLNAKELAAIYLWPPTRWVDYDELRTALRTVPESRLCAAIADELDISFKDNVNEATQFIQKLSDAWNKTEKRPVPQSQPKKTTENITSQFSRLYAHRSKTQDQKTPVAMSDIEKEFSRYNDLGGEGIFDNFVSQMKEKNINENEWRFRFWEINQSEFPLMGKVAIQIFKGSKDSTAMMERTFSTASLFLSKLRDRLLAKTIEKYIQFGSSENFKNFVK